jgi:dihydroorotate dehydrogenase electron transfer subunit
VGYSKTRLFACGPHAMLKAVAKLATGGQVSLEAHMACGFGGCAGCVVPILTGEGWNYRRVCVVGPVFDISQVAWQHF